MPRAPKSKKSHRRTARKGKPFAQQSGRSSSGKVIVRSMTAEERERYGIPP